MEAKLNGITVWPGVIYSHSSTSKFGELIKVRLGGDYADLTGDVRNNCPTHNGIIVEHAGRLWVDGIIVEQANQLWIGESVPPKAKRTPFSEYEQELASGKIHNMQLFEVLGINRARQALAADRWTDNVLNEIYDYPAIFWLMLPDFVANQFPGEAGWECGGWCTEGVGDAYAAKDGADYDVLQNINPTPFTVIKRWKEGRLKLLGRQSPVDRTSPVDRQSPAEATL